MEGETWSISCSKVGFRVSKANDEEEHRAQVEDPLSDPFVRMSLDGLRLSSFQLVNMSVKELNRTLISCPAHTVSALKKCRRTLKNRGYAKSCRIKRIAARNRLESINAKLMIENRELRQHNEYLLDQINYLQANQQIASVGVSAQTASPINRLVCSEDCSSTNCIEPLMYINDESFHHLIETELGNLVDPIVSDRSSKDEPKLAGMR